MYRIWLQVTGEVGSALDSLVNKSVGLGMAVPVFGFLGPVLLAREACCGVFATSRQSGAGMSICGPSLAVWSRDGNFLSVCLRLLEAGITICLVSLWLSGARMAIFCLSVLGCLKQG